MIRIGRVRLAYYTVVFGALLGWLGWRALHPDQITLSLRAGGAIEINGQATRLEDVVTRLQALDAAAPSKTVTIAAQADVPAALLVDLVDRARSAGVADLRYETLP